MYSSGSPAPAYVRRGACCVRPLDAESDASSLRAASRGNLSGTVWGRPSPGRRVRSGQQDSEAGETWAMCTIRSTPDEREPEHEAFKLQDGAVCSLSQAVW